MLLQLVSHITYKTMSRIYNKKIRETLDNIFNKNCCLYKRISDWLLDKDCCNNIYFCDEKIFVVAFKDNLVVCKEFINNESSEMVQA